MPKMYLADRRLIVVDQADDRFGVRRFDDHFFFQLATHALAVDVRRFVVQRGQPHFFSRTRKNWDSPRVDRRDVSADADAALGMEPAFAHSGATLVFEQVRRTVSIGPAKEHVRNELFEARIAFHFAACAVLDVVAINQVRPIAIDVARKSLEVSQLAKQAGWHDENSFLGDDGHDVSSGGGQGEGDRELVCLILAML